MQSKVPASLTATPENMSMLNTPGNGAIELDVMAHHDQVAPPASHKMGIAASCFSSVESQQRKRYWAASTC